MSKISKRYVNKLMSTKTIDIRIGVKGVSEGLKNEVKRRLESKGYVKIKILKNARDKVSSEDIVKMANEIGALVACERGRVFLLVIKRDAVKRRSGLHSSSDKPYDE
ncbi:MAG: YhbY family RNA-binding protein [Sulfolobales archaeon]